jgi:tetratricopeptide (TPR) repeat protein
MNPSRSALVLGAAAALASSAAGAQAKPQCEIDENNPKEIATASFMIQRARAEPRAPQRLEQYKKIVKSLTEKNDQRNPVGRNYQLGKIFYSVLEDSTAPQMMKRGDLGFVTSPEAMVDLAVAADSTMRIVETAMPQCTALTNSWRRQQGWLRVTQKASRLYNEGQYDSAAYYSKRSIVLDPSAPYGYSILATLAQRNNDIPGAVSYTRQAAEASKADTAFADQRRASLFNVGILVGSQAEAATGEEQKRLARESAEAFKVYLAEAGPSDENASAGRSSLARMLSIAGDTAAVRQTYAAVLENPANYGEYDLIQAGLAASRAGKDEDAAKIFRVAADQNPYSRDALYNLSASLFNAKKYTEALPHVKRLVEIDPNNAESWRIMAGVYQGLAKATKNVAQQKALNDTLLNAFNKYDKMPTVVTIRSFTHEGTKHTVTGTVENRGAAAGNYDVAVEFLDRSGKVVATSAAKVGPVAPKAKADFKVQVEHDGIVAFRYAALK